MEVKVGEGKDEVQKALKQFTRMVKKSELMHELKRREYFLKPSKKKIFKRQEALRRKKRDEKRISRQNNLDN